ncbi:LuxR C-terminal-related transcriptional regulator [Actinomadura hibisca]|uniref:LuxR C-terminal-related transcriptional regulator n=1 Tax=Actinomadura hibisca TaxID=68565 RepID=UPI00082B06D2|nr:LuxR C-terminal-related transcriptional regulator [Actinomadura hibisca]
MERRSGRLPAELTSFVGRRAELAEIRGLFGRCRLVTLMGPGGVGKTRLAVRAAAALEAAMEDGVCFVDLSALREPGLLAQKVAEELGVLDQDPAGALDGLALVLAEQRVLLVLDTCEHLVDACALLAEVLLRAAPGLRMLVTSRRPLDVTGEHTLVVAPLARPEEGGVPDAAASCEAVELFAERAAAVSPGWRVTDANRAAVALLCHRMDGIPLAIELAAVQLRALSVEQLVERLDRRILNVRGRRTGLPRHQTLRAAIDWSHELCTPQERLLWARLSVFAGDFGLEAAEEVCGGDDLTAVLDDLSELIAKSVVLRVDRDGTARYRMLDTLREYGAERLEELGETAAMRDRAFAWYAARLRRAHAELGTAAQPRWQHWFRHEHANVSALLDHGMRAADVDTLVATASALGRLLALGGLIGEARHWVTRILDSRDLRDDVPAEPLALAALLATLQSDPDGAAECLEPAERRALADGDRCGLAYVRESQGLAALYAGRAEEAARLLAESVGLHRQAGTDDVLVPTATLFLSVACALNGDIAAATRHAADAVEATEAAGELWCRSYGQCAHGMAQMLGGDPEQALPWLREGLRIKRDLGDRMGVALALDMIGATLITLGDAAAGMRLFGVADRLREFTGTTLFGPLHSTLRTLYEQTARDKIGEDDAASALREGVLLEMDRAVAVALDEIPAPGAAADAAPPRAADAGDAAPGRRELTPRELEIAGLVAEGLSNREIADRLVIAKRTVDSHVEHILGKLDYSSRAQVAAWFARLH